MARQRYSGWQGLAFFAGIQAASWGLRQAAAGWARPRRPRTDREIYARSRLPWFAPPPAVFPLAWGINSAAAIAGGLHVLNLPAGKRGRREYLAWQAAAWGLYASFEATYAGLQSPLNALAITAAFSATTFASIRAAGKMRDRRAALALAPTAAWLALALPLGMAQAAWNRDRFWRLGPLVQPRRQWLKRAS